MIVQFTENIAATPVYVNPEYVVSIKPDPENPDTVARIKLRDGEELAVRGDPEVVARKLEGEA